MYNSIFGYHQYAKQRITDSPNFTPVNRQHVDMFPLAICFLLSLFGAAYYERNCLFFLSLFKQNCFYHV